MNLKAIKDRLVSLLKDKSSGIQPEFRQQLSNIVKRIEDLLRDNRGECDIPDDLIKEIARCLVPDIIAFFETEEAKREFEEWKKTNSCINTFDNKSSDIKEKVDKLR